MCLAGVAALQYGYPRLASRMVSLPEFALLLVTSLSAFVVQSEAIYLRAHKREPFLWQSSAAALLTCAGIWILVPRWGTFGAVSSYFLSTGVIGLVWATIIFQRARARRGHLHWGSNESREFPGWPEQNLDA